MKPLRAALFGTLALLLAGCATPSGITGTLPHVRGVSPPAVAATTGNPAPLAASAQAAVEQVIQRANQEQQEALAQGKPQLMQDTATPAYYRQAVQINQDLAGGGVTAIQLANLQWGPITVQGSQAQATTIETWRTTFSDGSRDVSTDRNVYTLVQQNGAWKIQSDTHPDSAVDNTGGASPGTQPASPAPAVGLGQGQSRNWSGYAATGGNFTSVTGTWTVPQPASGSFGTTRQYPSSHSSAKWVEEAPSGSRRLIPLDNFGAVQFTAGSAVENGKTVSIRDSQATPITMVDASGRAVATPSALGADGSSFSVSRAQGGALRTPGLGNSPFPRGSGRFPFGSRPGYAIG